MKVRSASRKLVKPQFILDTTEPVILEAQVFDIKYSLNPMPAGFHSWYCDSFKFSNCFAERVRHDKATTTDYATIYSLADRNTVKKWYLYFKNTKPNITSIPNVRNKNCNNDCFNFVSFFNSGIKSEPAM